MAGRHWSYSARVRRCIAGGNPAIQRDLFGKTLGLKQSQIKRLLHTYRRRVPENEIVSPELARHLTELSRETNRQIGVLIDRKGGVEHVMVGDAHKLTLPDIGRARAGQIRLRGLRLVHTHLDGEPLTRDDLTDLALLRLDLVAMVAVGMDGLPGRVQYAHLLPQNDDGKLWEVADLPSVHVPVDARAAVVALEGELARVAASLREVRGREKAILIGMATENRAAAESSLDELAELARSAGLAVMDRVLQMRKAPDPKYLIGRGKLEDVVLRSMQATVDVIVFDGDLSPSQGRHIGESTSLKIIDRTQLILDIFAQRAQSGDGKIQVELAQLKYMLPRLAARDDRLSRLTGGIGGRGPGETKLEVDRRRVKDRIHHLEERIQALSCDRGVRRKQRNRRGLPVVSIVGYTNSGKSTLLNAMTDSQVLAEDKLFATLDPTSRRLRFPQERELIITDTVGFIRDLPQDLVAAFRATLEELGDADLLLHVVDPSNPAWEIQMAAVERILEELGLSRVPRITVFNKADRLDPETARHLDARPDSVAVSALGRQGLEELLARVERSLWAEGKVAELPPAQAELSSGEIELAS